VKHLLNYELSVMNYELTRFITLFCKSNKF